MLRACRRVLEPGSPLAFYAVTTADGLTPDEVARALEAGPDHADPGPGYRALMETAGFTNVVIDDVTDEYDVTLSESIRARDEESAALIDLVGADVFAEGRASREQELAAIHDGLLRRYLVSGRRA